MRAPRRTTRAMLSPRVLMSYSTAKNSLNPFTQLLSAAIAQAGGEAVDFGWSTAIFGKYDLVHLHWPEHLLRGRRGARRLAVRALFLIFLLRSAVTRVPMVRTVHNLEPHDRVAPLDRLTLGWADRLTDHWILMNRSVLDPRRSETVIPHGDYRPWLQNFDQASGSSHVDGTPTRFLFFGLIKRYKGPEEVIRAFSGSPIDSPIALSIRGTPSDGDLAAEIDLLCSADARIDVQFGRMRDQDLIDEILASEFVVLPYRNLYNSGALLLALSCGRPVLVPEGAVAAELAAEFGDDWVIQYDSPLEAADLLALSEVPLPAEGPNLQDRAWPEIGHAHVRLYRSLISSSKGALK